MYILAGNDISKINNTIKISIKKYSFEVTNYVLSVENYSEILGNLNTSNLFGERVLSVVDITDVENEISEKFIENSKEVKDLYVVYQKKLDSRTKFAKFLVSKKALVYELDEEIKPFEFGDFVVSRKSKEAYQEMINLEKKGIDKISLFSGILTSFRNILNIKFAANAKKSIFPSKVPFYTKISESLTSEDVIKIHSVLYENDLKFKKGEINEEMLVLHSMNYILNYGSNK